MPPRTQAETETMTMTDEVENEEIVEEEERDPLQIIAETFENAPSVEMLSSWKAMYRNIFAFNPDSETIYIFRALRRLEHRTITQSVRQLSESQASVANPSLVEDHLQEKVLTTCLLSPSVTLDLLNGSEAGLIPTLFNLIMEHSKFLAPERAMASTFKL